AGKGVLIAAADTFRAAAVEQLEEWGRRAGTEVIRQKTGADPAAVVFDAVKAAMARRIDVLLVDTAGRLHTKSNLMDELAKLKRVISRQLPGAPHESLMVIEAPTGQNGLEQARLFHRAIGLTWAPSSWPPGGRSVRASTRARARPMPRSWPWPRREPSPAAPISTSPSSRAITRAGRRPVSTPSCRPACGASSRLWPTPIRESPGAAPTRWPPRDS